MGPAAASVASMQQTPPPQLPQHLQDRPPKTHPRQGELVLIVAGPTRAHSQRPGPDPMRFGYSSLRRTFSPMARAIASVVLFPGASLSQIAHWGLVGGQISGQPAPCCWQGIQWREQDL